MKYTTGGLSCLLLVLAQSSLLAQDGTDTYAEELHEPDGLTMLTQPEYQVFGTEVGGAGDVAPFYALPSHHYTGWYRPRAIGRDQYARCTQDSFRPRGFGNLFARQWNERRVDYGPYRVRDWHTPYGPAYYTLAPDERCEDCDHQSQGSGGGHCSSCQSGHCRGNGLFQGHGGLWRPGSHGASGCDACDAAGSDCDSCLAGHGSGRRNWVHLITGRDKSGVHCGAASAGCSDGCATNAR